jgi:hypothetical protein
VAKAVGAVMALQDPDLPTQALHNDIVESLYRHLQQGRSEEEGHSKSSTGALDDTTGWRALETNLQGLASYCAASGADYFLDNKNMTPQLLQAVQDCSVKHVNRHVRAAGIAVLEQWIHGCSNNEPLLETHVLAAQAPLRTTVVTVLKHTLADNWSQVRMAASVLCRVLFQVLLQHPPEYRTDLYPTLLPRMCLNRFYLAQGVKLYSHETWKLVFCDGSGLETVAQNAGAMARYYIQMCDADNHAVREAACQAVAELAQKVGTHTLYKQHLEPHVTSLLQALIMCFHDESWPVRDEACLACGRFCRAYPDQCRSELNLLQQRWFEQVTDQIWSVRQDAAVALGDAMVAYPTELPPKVLEWIKTNLPSAKNQPAMTKEEYKKHENDIEAHSEQQLYSCGSLAPKLRKSGAGRIGCSSCGISRPKAPWEVTDGCIYLVREYIRVSLEQDNEVPEVPDETLLPLMQDMADVCRVKHFPQADGMRATLFRQLPEMATMLGKQRFKRLYLETFLDLIMDTLDSRTASALSQHAAGQCAQELAQLVGEGIFRGRLDDHQQHVFDGVMRERREQLSVPEAFSPFGPPGMFTVAPSH